jgi:2-amino-4-hydroxy-6-hydroxymethyldihydropteridine diphosphokinase
MKSDNNIAFLGLGTNLGDRIGNLNYAISSINKLGTIKRLSTIVESPAWGYDDPKPYLNMALEFHTRFNPSSLMQALLTIELEGGRERRDENSYEARTIDLDILFFNNQIIDLPGLQVPHPRLHLRRFVLKPLVEIAPHFVHPLLGETLEDLLKRCTDPSEIKLYGG